MFKKVLLAVSVTCLMGQSLQSNQFLGYPLIKDNSIKILCSAALVPPSADHHQDVSRKEAYAKSLNTLKRYGLETYVVESIASGPTYLDEYCNHVCYTQSNNAFIRNHGINEAVSMLIGLKHFNFKPDDMIIKLTGRYSLESDEFIRLVQYNSDVDAIVRAWSENDVYTVLFAIRAKYFLDFLDNYINFQRMYQENIALEHLFGAYITKIRNEGARIIYLPRVYDYLPVVGRFESHR